MFFYITAKVIYLLQLSLDDGNVLHFKILNRHHLTMFQHVPEINWMLIPDRMSIQSISGTCCNNVTQDTNG